MIVQPAVVLEGRSQVQVSAGSRSGKLKAGVYDAWAAADTYIAVGDDDNLSVSSSTGYFVPAGRIIPIRIGRDGLRIASTAALSIHQVE